MDAEGRTHDTDADIEARLAAVRPKRRRDAERVLDLMARVTGERPMLWSGGIIGFGEYRYRYASGRSGTAPAASLAPRGTATVVYLPDGVGAHTAELERLGPHTTGVGCLYLSDVDAIDLAVLERILTRSVAALTAGVYPHRAREGGS